ncbi:MAG TPA: DUF2061 domain-containing protein [Euryarchaeota archaeon]|nr:DUF2061 domain-containing protein [Euryarchaeota archaeon]
MFKSESRRKSLLKSITYRIICIISLLTVTYIITGDVVQSSFITVVFQAIQTVLYYLHERIWERYIPKNA